MFGEHASAFRVQNVLKDMVFKYPFTTFSQGWLDCDGSNIGTTSYATKHLKTKNTNN
jgi:hypothetical protein